MSEKVHTAIIGAGSAGLSALRQVEKQVDRYIVIDPGPLGTKCAWSGCMPSKALIQVAKDYHRRRVFEAEGLQGAECLHADIPGVMQYVRSLRDHFTQEMIKATRQRAGDHLVTGNAEILEPNRLRVGTREFETEFIIIATGARPVIPEPWKPLSDRLFTSENVFEQNDLPQRMAVIGLGPIGLELGQSFSRLGIEMVGFDKADLIGALTDPAINEASLQSIRREFPVHLGTSVELHRHERGLIVKRSDDEVIVNSAILAIGVHPNLQNLGLEHLGIPLDKRGVPDYDPKTLQIEDLPIFLAGDVNGCRPFLHEALDEGLIAGRNSVSDQDQCYCRRTNLAIVFSDPNIAQVGMNYAQVLESDHSCVIGKADFSKQSRAMLERRNHGLIHLYVDREEADILGAELVCPDAEHLAHFLAITIRQGLTVADVLQMPFYHPTIEEGLRSALQNAAKQLSDKHTVVPLELCDHCPEFPLC